jgi:putative phage-type endonuclease
MKKHLVRHLIETHSPEWYEFRANGVGSSEIGTVLGLNQYQLAGSLFLEKIGYRKPFEGNVATYWGTVNEQQVADGWERLDPNNPDSLNTNLKNGTKYRTCHKVKGYIGNPQYPWMFTSPDRIANKGQFSPFTGEVIEEEFIVECKTAIGFVLKKWEDGVPPTYIAQVQQQMMMTELNYSEIAILGDGRNLEIFPVLPSEYMQETIAHETEVFWNVCLQGKVLMDEYNSSKSEEEKTLIMDKIHDIFPRPKEGQEELYKEFLNKKYVEDQVIIKGDEDVLSACMEMNQLEEVSKNVKNMIEGRKNIVREFMAEHDTIEFDLYPGRVTWKTNKRGSRVFSNKVKSPVDVEGILEHIKTSI